jgi:hypothetical protein
MSHFLAEAITFLQRQEKTLRLLRRTVGIEAVSEERPCLLAMRASRCARPLPTKDGEPHPQQPPMG